MKHRIGSGRLWILFGCVLAALAVVSWRFTDVAWHRHDWFTQAAASQAGGLSNILLRGNIYLQSGAGQPQLVATNKKFPFAQMNAATVDPAHRDQVLSVLGGSIPRHLTDAQAAVITSLNFSDVTVGYETDRAYPLGSLAADVIGFYGYGADGNRAGQYGVESAFDKELTGSATVAVASSSLFARLQTLIGQTRPDQTSAKPKDIELTIDRNVQAYAQQVLTKVLKQYKAASGVLLVQEPTTGRLLAVADSPSFDPNFYGSSPISSFQDGALESFEPGSSFKPFTMAIGMDVGVIKPTTTYNDNHDIVVDGYTINNFNQGHFGLVTMTQVLEKSINAGVMFVQSLLSHDQFLQGVINSGFGQKTGVDLPGESAGSIENLYSGRPINFMTASFGQGITATPLQLIDGYSAIANGGKLMKPLIVEALDDSTGKRQEVAPEIIGTPISAKTAANLRTMLVSVVDKGFDKARIPRYDVAGKTGTAQIASPTGGYIPGQYNHSFVGFAPASNPRFTVFIRMERPQGITYAADSLSPSFRDMMAFLLNYYNVPPTR